MDLTIRQSFPNFSHLATEIWISKQWSPNKIGFNLRGSVIETRICFSSQPSVFSFWSAGSSHQSQLYLTWWIRQSLQPWFVRNLTNLRGWLWIFLANIFFWNFTTLSGIMKFREIKKLNVYFLWLMKIFRRRKFGKLRHHVHGAWFLNIC